jgi:uncharacterized membrane protein
MAQMRNYEVYAGAVVLGALAGIRSMAAPAVLGRLSQKGMLDGVTGPLAIVSSSRFAPTTGLMAVGELVADKLPFTPNRTAAGPLLGRAFTGGVSGAVICSSQKRSAWLGALLGAAAAVGSAYGAYYLRKSIVDNSKVPDTIVGLAEDALVGVVGVALTSRLSA